MANSSDSIHGIDPQNLVGKLIRAKIYQTSYWKEHCFGLSAASLIDKAQELDHVGGAFGGGRKPTPFLCLTLKMLQLQPEKEIVVEFLKDEDNKYLRILAALYLRLVGKHTDVYQYLEPFYNDYKKLRRKLADGSYTLTHVDEFIEELLYNDQSCDITLPHLPKRWTLELNCALEPRLSALEDEFQDEDENDEVDMDVKDGSCPKCVIQDTRLQERVTQRRPRESSQDYERGYDRHHQDREGCRGFSQSDYEREYIQDKRRGQERDYPRRPVQQRSDYDRHGSDRRTKRSISPSQVRKTSKESASSLANKKQRHTYC